MMVRHLTCSCCGGDVLDTQEDNCGFEKGLYDEGFGMCRGCGGYTDDSTFEDLSKMTEDELWKHLGWAQETFYRSRIETLTNNLNEKNSKKFAEMPLWEKLWMVQRAIEEGIMI